MRNISGILKIMAAMLLICACGIKLPGTSAGYKAGYTANKDIRRYVPVQVHEPIPPAEAPEPKYPANTNSLKKSSAPEIPYIETTGAAKNYPHIKAQADEMTNSPITVCEEEPIVNRFIQEMQEEVNSEISAWIRIPGTNIDYPVVSADNNTFYLQRDIYKNESKAGSLFTDSRCARNFSGINTIIYGHNMKNRSMFGNLRLYADADFFREHRYGVLWTAYETYIVEIVAYMLVPSNDPEIFANPSSAEELHEYIKENARVYSEPGYFGKIVTLSTCSYEYDNARIVLVAGIKEEK